MDTFDVGQVLLGRYRVERVLGQGGMGIVVAARHMELGQLFALKFLLPSALGNTEAVERFLREARLAARLRSEHVTRVHDVGRLDNGAPYMVMEYLDGSDLKAVVKRGALTESDAVSCVLQVCDAMMEAHAAGIIHRDLKPANLFLVRRPNGSPCVKVLDFGISKDMNEVDLELTKTTASFGSALYMSPEQMTRTKAVDARADIWALGTILYELLTGQTPFQGSSMTEVVAFVLQEDPVPMHVLRPGVSPALEAIVTRCLSKRKEDRYQSAGGLAEALREALRAKESKTLGGVEAEAIATIFAAPMIVGESRPSAPNVLPPMPLAPTPEMGFGGATAQSWGQTGRSQTLRRTQMRRVVTAMVAMVAIVLAAVGWMLKTSLSTQTIVQSSPAVAPAKSLSAAHPSFPVVPSSSVAPVVIPTPSSSAVPVKEVKEVKEAEEVKPGPRKGEASAPSLPRPANPTPSVTSKKSPTNVTTKTKGPSVW